MASKAEPQLLILSEQDRDANQAIAQHLIFKGSKRAKTERGEGYPFYDQKTDVKRRQNKKQNQNAKQFFQSLREDASALKKNSKEARWGRRVYTNDQKTLAIVKPKQKQPKQTTNNRFKT